VKLAFKIAMRPGRRGNHVVDAFPDLIQAIQPSSAPTLEHVGASFMTSPATSVGKEL
jgi:hypothetical protein